MPASLSHANFKGDFGTGFYLTEDINQAREWAVCNPAAATGFVHGYALSLKGLKVLDLTDDPLAWAALVMTCRTPSHNKRYRLLAPRFEAKFGIKSPGFDVIKGLRADASFYYAIRLFAEDDLDLEIFLGILRQYPVQYCLKTPKALKALQELEAGPEEVPFELFNQAYNRRDLKIRRLAQDFIDSPLNTLSQVFSVICGDRAE